MMICIDCKHYPPKHDGSPCVDCWSHDHFVELNTNAHIVRNMTDEELSNLFWQLQNTRERRSTSGWLDWLKQEVEKE